VTGLLPPNATGLERAFEAAIAARLDTRPTFADLWSPGRCPSHLLPWLAWTLSVDVWDPVWSEGVKRRVVAESISVHRRKGTVGSVRDAIAAAGYPDAEIEEGGGASFLDDGSALDDGHALGGEEWAEYAVTVTRPVDIGRARNLHRLLAAVAPARCHLRRVTSTVELALDDGHVLDDGSALNATYVLEETYG
jgi:phage tail P2-like protein